MYNHLYIIMYEKCFTDQLNFKRDKITQKTCHFVIKIVLANVSLVDIEGHAYNENVRIK